MKQKGMTGPSPSVRQAVYHLLQRLSFGVAWILAPFIRRFVSTRGLTIVLPTQDSGSLGDHAMFAALVQELRAAGVAEVVYLPYTRGWPDFHVAAGPKVVSPWVGLAQSLTFARATHFYLIGGDVLDGHYSDRRTKTRLQMANLAARFGLKTRIVSFSFNGVPTSKAKATIAGLDARITLVPRDQVSASRLEPIAPCQIELGADLAFLLAPAPVQFSPPKAATTIGLVPNSLFSRIVGGLDSHLEGLCACLQSLLGSMPDAAIVLFGHDRRGHQDDWSICRAVVQRLNDSSVVVAPQLEDPGKVRSITSKMDLVITGRMHAAIGSLGASTPPLILGYQGKSEGLVQHFGLDTRLLVVQPDLICHPNRFVRAVTDVLHDAEDLRSAIHDRLPVVTASARRNLATEHRAPGMNG